MTDDLWEDGLRGVMTDTVGTARIAGPPTDVILRKGRSSLRRRNGLAGSGVLGVVAAAVIAGTSLVGSAGSAGGAASPGAASTSSGARLPQAADAVVKLGMPSAKTKVVLYEDYRCPPCKDLNAGLETTLRQDAANGKIQIEFRPTNLIDRNQNLGTGGSVVAGNAVLCAANSGAFYAYRDAVFANQPSETTDQFSNPARLVEIAHGIPGLDTAAFKKCVDDLPYAAAIARDYDTSVNTMHCPGMPCLIADGKQWSGPSINEQVMGGLAASWLSQIIASH